MDFQHRDLLEQLFRLQALLRHRHVLHHREHGPQGSPHQGQGRILALLKLKAEISQKELSTILDIRPQSLGELLTKLEAQGYIVRTPSEADRRGMEVRLTDEGRKASEQAETAESASFFDCLTPGEQETFSSYLARLIENLEQELGTDPRADLPFDRGRGREGHDHPFHGGRFHRGGFSRGDL